MTTSHTTLSHIKAYLATNTRENARALAIAWIATLAFGLILIISRTLAPVQALLTDHLLNEFVVDLPLKAAFIIIPLVILIKSKTYAQWTKAHPRIPISKGSYSAASYLEILLSIIPGLFALAIVWATAAITDPPIVDHILRVGILSLGEGFLWVSLMTTIIYTLQFTLLAKLSQGSILLVIALLGSLQIIILLQTPMWHAINQLNTPIPTIITLYTAASLAIFAAGAAITTRLYKKAPDPSE